LKSNRSFSVAQKWLVTIRDEPSHSAVEGESTRLSFDIGFEFLQQWKYRFDKQRPVP